MILYTSSETTPEHTSRGKNKTKTRTKSARLSGIILTSVLYLILELPYTFDNVTTDNILFLTRSETTPEHISRGEKNNLKRGQNRLALSGVIPN